VGTESTQGDAETFCVIPVNYPYVDPLKALQYSTLTAKGEKLEQHRESSNFDTYIIVWFSLTTLRVKRPSPPQHLMTFSR
jgi:hypothetical protein